MEVPEVITVFQKLKAEWTDGDDTRTYWIMRHQVVASCKDQERAKQDLDLLFHTRAIYQLCLPLSRQEMLLLLSDDYEDIVKNALLPNHPDFAARLASWVVFECPSLDGIITQDVIHDSLLSVLDTDTSGVAVKEVVENSTPVNNVATTVADIITWLIRNGILRQIAARTFCFMVPGTGRFISNLIAGRRSLLKFLTAQQRRKCKRRGVVITHEGGLVLKSELESRHKDCLSGTTSLSITYLLRDVIPLGIVNEVYARGNFIKTVQRMSHRCSPRQGPSGEILVVPTTPVSSSLSSTRYDQRN